MKLTRFVASVALSLSVTGLVTMENDAYAKDDDKKDAKEAKPSKPGRDGNIEKSFQISPKGLKWGMSLEQVSKLYDKVVEDEMLPLFQKAQPGLELEALQEELRMKQGALKRSRIDFGATPTGVDQSALKGEYSYNNGESMASLTLRSGTKRFFFFFSDRLWKIYDEHKLKAGSNLGGTFQEATKTLAKRFNSEPKVIASDFDKGRPFDEAEWRDPDKVIRAIDRGQTLGVVYAERRIHENLANYRKNKVETGPERLDSDVQAAMKRTEPPPDPKAKDKDKKKKKGAGGQ